MSRLVRRRQWRPEIAGIWLRRQAQPENDPELDSRRPSYARRVPHAHLSGRDSDTAPARPRHARLRCSFTCGGRGRCRHDDHDRREDIRQLGACNRLRSRAAIFVVHDGRGVRVGKTFVAFWSPWAFGAISTSLGTIAKPAKSKALRAANASN